MVVGNWLVGGSVGRLHRKFFATSQRPLPATRSPATAFKMVVGWLGSWLDGGWFVGDLGFVGWLDGGWFIGWLVGDFGGWFVIGGLVDCKTMPGVFETHGACFSAMPCCLCFLGGSFA